MQRLGNGRINPARWGVAAALLMLGTATVGAADAPRQWIVQGDETNSSLLYGTPESDDLVFGLRCDHTTRMLSVFYSAGPAEGRTPGTVEIAIKSPGGAVTLAGSGSLSDMDDSYFVDATTTLMPDLEKVLAEASTLTIAAGDRRSDIAIDATARTGIDLLIKNCRP